MLAKTTYQGVSVKESDSSSKTQHPRYYFGDLNQWSHVWELLFTANALAIIVAIASMRGIADFTWGVLLHHMLFVSWVTVCFALAIEQLQHFLLRLSRQVSLFICYVILLILVWFTTCFINFLEFYVNNVVHQLTWESLTQHSLRHLLLGGGLGIIVLRYLYVREQWIAQQQSELMARVQALQARIHPHFLFNSLNSVVSLISIDPFKAEQMLIDLSSLFRASLTELKEVSLAEEIELCQRYLKIEKVRLGDRLEVVWRLDSDKKLQMAKIPLLTLQPLLENTIYHGVETLSKKSTVSILVEVVDQSVNIVLTNPYQIKETSRQGNGVAIENVKQRLIAYYGANVKFNTFSRDGVYTTLLSYNYQK